MRIRFSRQRGGANSPRCCSRFHAVTICCLFAILAAGCGNLLPGGLPGAATPTLQSTVENTQPVPSVQPPTPAPPRTTSLWVPPIFDPIKTEAGKLLQSRLDQFNAANRGFQVSLRVKAASGPGGLLDALTTTSAAAPRALPGLILLNRQDMEAAALKGLILPLDNQSSLISGTDWYPYAKELASLQDSTFGLPLAGDALALVYRPARFPSPPKTWADIQADSEPLLYAADEPESRLALQMILSTGMPLQDEQGRPNLQVESLLNVLKTIQNGVRQGVFPSWLTQYQTDRQSWQAYRELRAARVIAWTSDFLGDLPADSTIAAIPPVGNLPTSLANGWLICLPDQEVEQSGLYIQLAEYLMDPNFLAQLTSSAGFLPTRPSALAGWQNKSMQTLLTPILMSAKVPPGSDIQAAINPILKDAVLQIVNGQSDPARAAQAAVERLGHQ